MPIIRPSIQMQSVILPEVTLTEGRLGLFTKDIPRVYFLEQIYKKLLLEQADIDTSEFVVFEGHGLNVVSGTNALSGPAASFTIPLGVTLPSATYAAAATRGDAPLASGVPITNRTTTSFVAGFGLLAGQTTTLAWIVVY